MKTTCATGNAALRLRGKESFLYSGEVHYFRIPRRYWRKHLLALKEAGCHAVSTYVPWSWHEFKEGTVDFTGRTHRERDLLGFLDLARELDLFIILKPGPYVMAETTDQGIPAWLTRIYPETLARDETGRPWGPAYVSVASPLFRRKTARWLRTFARRVAAPRQALSHGAVILVQLCNEIGMFEWLGGRGSWSAANLKAWRGYLRQRFPDIRELADLLGRPLRASRDMAPPSGPCADREQFVLYTLWHDYHRWLYADYVAFLADTLRQAGLGMPFFTNVGGWVYGRAHEFIMNGTFHRETAKRRPDVLYGLDHIPEFVTPSNLHDGIVANQVASELQRGRGPLYSAEMQCGSREHGVQPYPDELALFYRLCLIHGLTGMNFYMFSQGKNPRGRGVDGPMFYWYNAVDYRGERQPVYPVIQELGRWLALNGSTLIRSRRTASLAVALYPPLYETEFLVPTLQKQSHLDAKAVGLASDPVIFRNQAIFDGVVRILARASVPFDLAAITVRPMRELRAYDRLVLVTNEIMDAATQTRLVEYLRGGGRLIIFPMCPRYDRAMRPCHILRDTLGIRIMGQAASNRVYMDGLKDIPVAGIPNILSTRGGRTLAVDAKGRAVGVEKRVGKGRVRYFGFHLHYTIEEHPKLWSAMMELDTVARPAVADAGTLHVQARFAGREGILFVGNFHRMPMASAVGIMPPRGARAIDLGRLRLPPQTGLLLPIRVGLAPGLELRYAHAELLERKSTRHGVTLTLRGPMGSEGRVALQSRRKPGITLEGGDVFVTRAGAVTTVTYRQTGAPQTLRIHRAR